MPKNEKMHIINRKENAIYKNSKNEHKKSKMEQDMNKLVIEGNDVYEIDEECVKQKEEDKDEKEDLT